MFNIKKIIIGVVLITTFMAFGMEESDSNSEREKPLVNKPLSPIISRLDFLAALNEVAFGNEDSIAVPEKKPTESDILDKLFSGLNTCDFNSEQKYNLFNTILTAYVQNGNLQKVKELVQTLENNSQCDPWDIIADEPIKAASMHRKQAKCMIPTWGREKYVRSRAIHRMLDKYAEIDYNSFSSDSENEDENSGYNSDQDSPSRNPKKELEHFERVYQRNPSPELPNTLTANGLFFDSPAQEIAQLLESQISRF